MKIQHTIQTSGLRLDRYLADELPGQSRSSIQRLIREQRVLHQGSPLRPAWITAAGIILDIDLPDARPAKLVAEHVPLAVVFEDEWLLVVNKPQGMVVHPGAGHSTGTLVNALLTHGDGRLSNAGGLERPGIVHRIDKDTSGLLIVVKDNQIHAALGEKLRRHEIERTYTAFVYGTPAARTGTVDAPIGRDPAYRQRMAVVRGGKPAITHFTVTDHLTGASIVQARLETGRTHQIRVHLNYIGHPVIGDPIYAAGREDFGLSGQALHAGQLSFRHPVTEQDLTLTAPLPEHLVDLKRRLQ